MTPEPQTTRSDQPILSIRELDIMYEDRHAIKNLSLDIMSGSITALIGVSGCGKSVLLRSLSLLDELEAPCHRSGAILFHGQNLLDDTVDRSVLRRTVAYIAPQPRPFPVSVYENIAWPARAHRYRGDMDELVELALKEAGLWDEVRDKLRDHAETLSAGQQQRLCLARALALAPEVLCLDEPTAQLDPLSGGKIETLIETLKGSYTIIIGTHNMQQASRLSDDTAYLLDGVLVETGPTPELFFNPRDQRTERYITGRFG